MPIHHVIIGGGPAATNALETIRQFGDPVTRITLICDEPAHSRMALPYWLAGQIPRDQTLTADEHYFRQHRVDARIGARVTALDPAANRLTLDDGAKLDFDRLLIATGSSPANPPIPGAEQPGVQPLWTLANTDAVLQSMTRIERPRVVLVGVGFIGCIMLNAMFKRDWQLTVVEREKQVLPRMLDAPASGLVARWLDQRGIAVHTETSVGSIQAGTGGLRVQLQNGSEIEADRVILATGVRANVAWLAGSGVGIDEGILVDERMQTSRADVFAAGDVAQGPVLPAGEPAIHAIQPTAVEHGRIAGANMAGHAVRYAGSLLMNVADVCGLQCASFGRWNDRRADTTTIANSSASIYRKYVWQGDTMVGAMFTGRANDVGMLTDVGMIKGIIQTQTDLGPWKQYIHEKPFDIRRAYIATCVARKLVDTTLLGRPTADRTFRYENREAPPARGSSHAVFFKTPTG